MSFRAAFAAIEEWVLPISYPPYVGICLMLIIFALISKILPKDLIATIDDFFDSILTTIGLIEPTSSSLETASSKDAYRSERIIHGTENITIINSDRNSFFSSPRTDIIRYRPSPPTFSASLAEYDSSDHEEPTVFFHDEELQHIKPGLPSLSSRRLFPLEGKYSNIFTELNEINDIEHESKSTTAEFSLMASNLAQAILRQNSRRGKTSAIKISRTLHTRTERILFTYHTGRFFLEFPSPLRNEIYSLSKDLAEQGSIYLGNPDSQAEDDGDKMQIDDKTTSNCKPTLKRPAPDTVDMPSHKKAATTLCLPPPLPTPPPSPPSSIIAALPEPMPVGPQQTLDSSTTVGDPMDLTEETASPDTSGSNTDGDKMQEDEAGGNNNNSDTGSDNEIPPLVNDDDDDDDDDDNEEALFPTPDSRYYLESEEFDTETMSNASDDHLFSNLSDSFSQLQLGDALPLLSLSSSPPSKPFRVTKARERRLSHGVGLGIGMTPCYLKTKITEEQTKMKPSAEAMTDCHKKGKSPKDKKDDSMRAPIPTAPSTPVTAMKKTRTGKAKMAGLTTVLQKKHSASTRQRLPKAIERSLMILVNEINLNINISNSVTNTMAIYLELVTRLIGLLSLNDDIDGDHIMT